MQTPAGVKNAPAGVFLRGSGNVGVSVADFLRQPVHVLENLPIARTGGAEISHFVMRWIKVNIRIFDINTPVIFAVGTFCGGISQECRMRDKIS